MRRRIIVLLLTGALAPTAAAHAAPPGYETVRTKLADLDGDGRADRIEIQRRVKAGQGGSRPRHLVIRQATGSGFRTAGTGKRILLCTRCGGAFYGLRAPTIRLSVRAGVLVVRQDFGSREVTEQAFRLRLRDGAVTLIGYDELVRDRATGDVTQTSTNLLTGERVRDSVASNVGACEQPLRRVRVTDPLRGC